MIWAYSVKSNVLHAKDSDSVEDLKKHVEEADWLWIDCLELDSEEHEILKELFNLNKSVTSLIQKKEIFPRYLRTQNQVLISIPLVLYKDSLDISPIYVLFEGKTFVTIRWEGSSKPVENALKVFMDCISNVPKTCCTFVITRLLHEVINENLDALLSVRQKIDGLEEKALEKPGLKEVNHSVFSLKREISVIERTLWSQQELVFSMSEGVIPSVETSEKVKAALNYSINNVSRELSLLESYNNALDSILSLQDLGMIHRVERTLIYFTITILVTNFLLILLEIGIFKRL